MSRIYYRGARGAIVCYDLTDKTSFERAKFWVNELKNNEEVSIFRCVICLVNDKWNLLIGIQLCGNVIDVRSL